MLKSQKGICLQLESGKVIAIRASMNRGQQAQGVEQKLGSFSGAQSQPQANRPAFPPKNDGDVIDISNDDDEDDAGAAGNLEAEASPAAQQAPQHLPNGVLPPIEPMQSTSETIYKEKVVYKPNLVPRRSKMPPPPPIPYQESSSGFHSHLRATPPNFSRNIYGNQNNHSAPFSNCKLSFVTASSCAMTCSMVSFSEREDPR